MRKKINIGDSELPIMQILWEKGPCTSPEIFENMDKNINTLKTLLKRLVDKGAIDIEKINSRTYRYIPAISEEEYIECERENFLHNVFRGSKEKLLLNFVKEENVTKQDLEYLMKIIDEE